MAAVIVCMIQRVLLYRIYFMHYNNLTIVQRSSLWIVTQANCSLMLTFKLHRNITLNNKMCIVTIRVTASVVSNLWIWPQTRFSFIVPGHFSKKKETQHFSPHWLLHNRPRLTDRGWLKTDVGVFTTWHLPQCHRATQKV